MTSQPNRLGGFSTQESAQAGGGKNIGVRRDRRVVVWKAKTARTRVSLLSGLQRDGAGDRENTREDDGGECEAHDDKYKDMLGVIKIRSQVAKAKVECVWEDATSEAGEAGSWWQQECRRSNSGQSCWGGASDKTCSLYTRAGEEQQRVCVIENSNQGGLSGKRGRNAGERDVLVFGDLGRDLREFTAAS